MPTPGSKIIHAGYGCDFGGAYPPRAPFTVIRGQPRSLISPITVCPEVSISGGQLLDPCGTFQAGYAGSIPVARSIPVYQPRGDCIRPITEPVLRPVADCATLMQKGAPLTNPVDAPLAGYSALGLEGERVVDEETPRSIRLLAEDNYGSSANRHQITVGIVARHLPFGCRQSDISHPMNAK